MFSYLIRLGNRICSIALQVDRFHQGSSKSELRSDQSRQEVVAQLLKDAGQGSLVKHSS